MRRTRPAQEKIKTSQSTTVDAVLSSASGLDGGQYSFGGHSLQITERCLSRVLRDAIGALERATARRYTTRGSKRNHPHRQHGSVGPTERGNRKSDVGGSFGQTGGIRGRCSARCDWDESPLH